MPQLLTYHCCLHPALVPDDPWHALYPSRTADLTPNQPIALHKSIWSTRNAYPHYNFLSNHHLSLPHYAFISILPFISLFKTTREALSHSGWRQAMTDKMSASHTSGTWELVYLLLGKFIDCCRWVYAGKIGQPIRLIDLRLALLLKGILRYLG